MCILNLSSILVGSAGQSPTSEEKPSSPFDISKIHKVFDDPNIYSNLSPVTSPSHPAENRYSRHSSQRNSEEQETGGRTLRVSGDHGVKTHPSGSSLVAASRIDGSDGTESGQGTVGVNEVENALDKLVASSTKRSVPSISVSVGDSGTSGELTGEGGGGGGEVERPEEVVRESTEEDRMLEFEGESEGEPRTSSSVSLDNSQTEATLLTVAHPPESVCEKDASSSPAVEVSQEMAGEGEGEGEGETVESVPAPAGMGEEKDGDREGVKGEEEERRKSEEVERGAAAEEVGRRGPGHGDGSIPHRKLPSVPAGSPELSTKVRLPSLSTPLSLSV